MHQKIITTIAIWLVAALLLTGCDQLAPKPAPTAVPVLEGEVTPVVNATGVIVPVQTSTLSLSTAGVVAEVLVSENQVVAAGQALVRLEGQEAQDAAESAARLELAAATQALDRLYDDPDVRAAAASQTVTLARQAVDDAEKRVTSLNSKSTQADIDQAQANVVLARDRLDKAREDYEPYANKPEDNLVRAALLSKMAQIEKEYDAAVRLYNNLLGVTNPLDLAEAAADLELAKARLAAAEREYAIEKEGPDPDDIRLAEERLANAGVQLAAAEAARADLVLQAPFGGTVTELNVRIGEWVNPGQPVLVLADLTHLRVETTDLNEIDVARIIVGDDVIVTFDALPEVEMQGRVTSIAPKASSGSGVNYKVTIELSEIPAGLRWGMTAFVDIMIR